MGERGKIYSVLIVFFVVFSLAPTIYELSRRGDLKPDRSFELVHNFPTDYNFYLSRIRQGVEGRWTVVERYTSEPHAGSVIHEFYLLLGRVGRFVRVPLHRTGDIYHVARVVLGVALLAAVAAYCQGAMGTRGAWGIVAFMLAVTASSFPKLVEVNGILRFGGYMAWWSVMDSLQRITFIPHILLGQTLVVLMALGLTTGSMFRTTAHALFFGIAAFVLGLVFPPGLLFVYAVFGVWALLSLNRLPMRLISLGIVVMVSVPALLALGLMTSLYPWKRLVEVDIIRPLPFDYLEYFKAVGVIGVIGVIGGMRALWEKERRLYPAVAWVIAWIVLLVFFRFVPQQSPLRFSEMAPHVPLAVLSAYLLKKIGERRALRGLGGIAAGLLVAIGLFHMYSSFLWQKDFIDHKIRATLPLVPTGSYVMYPLKDFINAMWYLYDRTKGEGVILAETTAGNYIPVVSGNPVFVGHDNTVAFEEKKELVKAFFSGRMPVDQARMFVRQSRASYVFFGPQEREDGGIADLRRVYPFLTEGYRNAYVTVYKTP